MKTYASNAKELSAHQELRSALVELGFKSGMPSMQIGSVTGKFWLLADDAKKMEKMIGKESSICIETENRKYMLSYFPTHKAAECTFFVINKESQVE